MIITLYYSIMHILIIALTQAIIANIWYSKYLFNIVLEQVSSPNNLRFMSNILIKSILFYAITNNLFFILPQLFFYIIVLFCVLIAIYEVDSYALKVKKFNTTLVNVSYSVITAIVGFYLALLLLT